MKIIRGAVLCRWRIKIGVSKACSMFIFKVKDVKEIVDYAPSKRQELCARRKHLQQPKISNTFSN